MPPRCKRSPPTIIDEGASASLTSVWTSKKQRTGAMPGAADKKQQPARVTHITLKDAYAAAAASAALKPVSKFKAQPTPKVDHKVPTVDGGVSTRA